MELLFGTKNERAVTVNKNFIYNFRPVNLRQCRTINRNRNWQIADTVDSSF